MTRHTFLGPGTHWTYEPGKVVAAGKAVDLTAEQAKAAAAAGISLTEDGEEVVAAATRPSDPNDASPEPSGNPASPHDGTASVNVAAPPAESDAAGGKGSRSKQ